MTKTTTITSKIMMVMISYKVMWMTKDDKSNYDFSDLENFDLQLYSDEIYDDVAKKPVEVFYIGELEDRSVGIFGDQLSPNFHTMKGLYDWWRTIKDIMGVEENKSGDDII